MSSFMQNGIVPRTGRQSSASSGRTRTLLLFSAAYLAAALLLRPAACEAQSGFSPGVTRALPKTQGAAEDKSAKPKGANDPNPQIKGNDEGTPGPLSGTMGPKSPPPPPGTTNPGGLPPPGIKPPQSPLDICEIIFGILQQLKQQDRQNGQQGQNGGQPPNTVRPPNNAQPPNTNPRPGSPPCVGPT